MGGKIEDLMDSFRNWYDVNKGMSGGLNPMHNITKFSVRPEGVYPLFVKNSCKGASRTVDLMPLLAIGMLESRAYDLAVLGRNGVKDSMKAMTESLLWSSVSLRDIMDMLRKCDLDDPLSVQLMELKRHRNGDTEDICDKFVTCAYYQYMLDMESFKRVLLNCVSETYISLKGIKKCTNFEKYGNQIRLGGDFYRKVDIDLTSLRPTGAVQYVLSGYSHSITDVRHLGLYLYYLLCFNIILEFNTDKFLDLTPIKGVIHTLQDYIRRCIGDDYIGCYISGKEYECDTYKLGNNRDIPRSVYEGRILSSKYADSTSPVSEVVMEVQDTSRYTAQKNILCFI